MLVSRLQELYMLAQICEFHSDQRHWICSLIRLCRVLLDDVLAAVDSHVARHVFGVCFGYPQISMVTD